jgi:hypothetical protein
MIFLLVTAVFPADKIPVFTNQDVERFNKSSSQKPESNKMDETEISTPQSPALREKSEQSSGGMDEAEKQQIEGIVKQIWSSMTNRLRSGDIEGALDYFIPQSRDSYREIFKKIGPEPVTSIVEIRFKTSYGPFIECLAIREERDGKFAYPVSFVKEDSGTLKIRGF